VYAGEGGTGAGGVEEALFFFRDFFGFRMRSAEDSLKGVSLPRVNSKEGCRDVDREAKLESGRRHTRRLLKEDAGEGRERL